MNSLTACMPVPIYFFAYSPPQISLLFVFSWALIGVILIKSVLFAWFSDLNKFKAFGLMVGANFVSTAPGLLIGGSFIVPPIGAVIFLIGLPFLSYHIGGMFEDGFRKAGYGWLTQRKFCYLVVVLSLFSLFFVSQGVLSNFMFRYGEGTNQQITLYFIYKAIMMFAGLSVTLLLTIAFEGGVIFSLIDDDQTTQRNACAVVAANIWTFLIVFLIGAIIALPLRMRHPDFMLEPQ
jgi:hypothetical protein